MASCRSKVIEITYTDRVGENAKSAYVGEQSRERFAKPRSEGKKHAKEIDVLITSYFNTMREERWV